MDNVASRTLFTLALGSAIVACGASDGDVTAPVDDSIPASESSSATVPDPSDEMSVAGPIDVGAEFVVSFSGALQESRGGYLWLQQPDGTKVALLRGDGNDEIPMGYDLDAGRAVMLDDGLSGDTATFVLPPQLAPGSYVICTANSAGEDCLPVEIVDS